METSSPKKRVKKNPNNMTWGGVVSDLTFYTYEQKGTGEAGVVCNLTITETFNRRKSKPVAFQFVCFDRDLAHLIANNYRNGDYLTVVRSWPYPCMDKGKPALKWQIFAIEAQVTVDSDFISEGEPEDDVPPI